MANMPMAMRRAIRDSGCSGSRNRTKALAPPTARAVVRKAASDMCISRTGKVGLKTTAHQSVAISPPSGWMAKPVGNCIQLLADRIQKAEIRVPMATSRVAVKCRRGPTFFQPKSMIPRKLASRKKAVRTSKASRGPSTGAENWAKTLQLDPNW